MDPTPSTWEQIARRASALRRRHGDHGLAPGSTWSLVGRAAQRFGDGAVPEAREPGHALAQWQLAMVSVLRDLHRRHETARRHGLAPGAPPELEPAADGPEPEDAEALACLRGALDALAEADERAARVLALRYAGELTWAQIAERVDASVTTVRRDWALGLAWLRRDLGRRGLTPTTESET